MTNFENLKQLIEDAQKDADKFYQKDNHAAGTRLRKAMQQIRKTAALIRTEIQAKKKNGEISSE